MKYTGTKWADRLSYLATVEDGWYDGEGDAIHPEVLEKANELLTNLDSDSFHLPALFPLIDDETDEGGISMEWLGLRTSNHVSLQISNSFSYWGFTYNRETKVTASLETNSFEEAYQFIRENLLRVNFFYELNEVEEAK